jgi:hypothetical protein
MVWMAAGCALSALAAIVFGGPGIGREVLLGMFGPLVVTSVTWTLTERVYGRHPETLTPLMVKAFAVKMVFFGAYVTVMLLGFRLRPVPFMVSFTGYFIVLHLTEALLMRRLFDTPNDEDARPAGGPGPA